MVTFLKNISLRWKFFLGSGLLVLISTFLMNFIAVHLVKARAELEFKRRTQALAENLSYNAKFGVLIQDKTELENLTSGFIDNADFAYVAIYSAQGDTLALRINPALPTTRLSHLLRWDPALLDAETSRKRAYGNMRVWECTRWVQVEHQKSLPEDDPTLLYYEDDPYEDFTAPNTTGTTTTTTTQIDHSQVEGVVRLALSMRALEREIFKTQLIGFLFAILFTAIGNGFAFFFSGIVVRPVSELTQATRIIAEGNLEHRIEKTSQDEIGQLAQNFNEMAFSIREIIRQLRMIASQLTSASAQILDTANNGASMAAQQAVSISETSATIQELAKTAEQISGTANQVFDRANATSSSVSDGAQAMEMATGTMHEIKQHTESTQQTVLELGELSTRIGGMSQMIEEIADRTKLIAFNAAIEAAGAGEAGRRFSVVANEVRTLAAQTASLTSDIEGLLEEIQVAVKKAVEVSEASVAMVEEGTNRLEETSNAFNHIQEMILQTTRSAREISLATRQQETASHQVVEGMSELAQTSQTAASGSQQTMNAAAELNRLAEQLKHIVDRFKIHDEETQF
ncbi:MAG: methyl-accepting chemotaxis protein [Gemmatimonadetes bacterium]|nr:MAG: methyl-accepting chemotaxis protein [Gemmatimonadota bacterium]